MGRIDVGRSGLGEVAVGDGAEVAVGAADAFDPVVLEGAVVLQGAAEVLVPDGADVDVGDAVAPGAALRVARRSAAAAAGVAEPTAGAREPADAVAAAGPSPSGAASLTEGEGPTGTRVGPAASGCEATPSGVLGNSGSR